MCVLIVQGDWNAKVGKNTTCNGCVGRFGTGIINDRGQRLLEFAERHKLVIANTLHPHKNSRISTCYSSNGQVHNQIDYILTPQRFKTSIIRSSTGTYPGAVINSDHDIVLCNLKLKLRSNKPSKNKRIQYNVNKLKDSRICNLYSKKLDEKLNDLEKNIDDYNSIEIYAKFEQIIANSALEIIGKYRSKKQPWITDDIMELCDERRILKSKKKQQPDLDYDYRVINSSIRKKMNKAKNDWIESHCK